MKCVLPLELSDENNLNFDKEVYKAKMLAYKYLKQNEGLGTFLSGWKFLRYNKIDDRNVKSIILTISRDIRKYLKVGCDISKVCAIFYPKLKLPFYFSNDVTIGRERIIIPGIGIISLGNIDNHLPKEKVSAHLVNLGKEGFVLRIYN